MRVTPTRASPRVMIGKSLLRIYGRTSLYSGQHTRYSSHRKMTPYGRIYSVDRIDERSGRYTAWRRRTCNTDSVSIPCTICTVHADSVACNMLTQLQHSVSVLSACATRTQYRAARQTLPHGPDQAGRAAGPRPGY